MLRLVLFFLCAISSMICQSQTTVNLLCKVYGAPFIASQANETGYNLNSWPTGYNGCGANSAFHVAVIDQACDPMLNCNLNVGQANFLNCPSCTPPFTACTGTCSSNAHFHFAFHILDSVQMDSMISFLASVSSGEYILIYTWFNEEYSSVPRFVSLKNVLNSFGASGINSLPDFVPYIFFCRKGDPSSVREVVGGLWSDTIQLQVALSCNTSGMMDPEKNPGISCAPNPVTDQLLISIKEETNSIARIRLFNVQGECVLSKNILANKADKKIDVHELPAGMYFLELFYNNKYYSQKIIKQKEN